MIKITTLVLVAVIYVQGNAPLPDYSNEIIEATKAGDFARVQALFSEIHRLNVLKLQTQLKIANPILTESVKNLKPIPGGHVHGEAESTYHAWSNINGQTSTKSEGHKVINDDGRITEFKFKPDPNLASIKAVLQNNPILVNNVKNLKPVPGGHVYGEAENTFHSATNFNGQTTVQSGGHKVINNDGKVTEYDFIPNVPVNAVNSAQGATLNVPISAQESVQTPVQTAPAENSGQETYSSQASASGQVPLEQVSGQIAGPLRVDDPNVHSTYYSTSSNSKSQTVQISGEVDNNPNLSQIKKVLQNNITPEAVKNLQPIPGGQVFGEAEKTYYTWKTVDGKTTIQTQGHKVVNNNGEVVEYDFKPMPNKDLTNVQTLIQSGTDTINKIRDLKPIPGGHVYGEAENNFQAFTNVNGQTFEKAGGHKIVNDDGKVTEYALQPNKKT